MEINVEVTRGEFLVREKILTLLSRCPDGFISGEKMSEQLHLTRAGIWKHIQGLREAGYEIESQTKNGYRLIKTPLALEEWVLRQKLTTIRLGQEIIICEELGSTNDYAKDLVRKREMQDGLVILAKKQKAGRGRLQREWSSPIGGIWMSVLLRPDLSLAEAAKLTLCTGIAVCKALEKELGIKVRIKWPNDIIFEGKKLAGILAEVVGEWNSVQTIIIGIGINANFPAEILPGEAYGISLQDILGKQVDLNQLTARILDELEQEFEISVQSRFAGLAERWAERAAGIGEEIEIIQQDKKISGIMKGIDGDGQMIVETEEGLRRFPAGEVRLRKPSGGYF